MCGEIRFSPFGIQASARLRGTSSEIVSLNDGFASAITTATPHRIPTGLLCTLDNDESPKALIADINECGHSGLRERLLVK
jgi:hypothetical protein